MVRIVLKQIFGNKTLIMFDENINHSMHEKAWIKWHIKIVHLFADIRV